MKKTWWRPELLVPIAFFLWLYRGSLDIWFRYDDFSLLQFVGNVHGWRDFLDVMVSPFAQGTIRPWSERLPFLLTWTLFGADCVPFRIAVLVTACADIVLIAWIAERLTGSRIAGFASPLFWAASTAIVSPMTWNSSYNEVQYPLFLLGALAFLIRYTETGRQWFWWGQLVVFVLGFGSLENNIVYPVIAVAWLLFAAESGRKKQLLVRTVPLFAISLFYFALHLKFAPSPSEGLYSPHFDLRIVRTLWEYWRWSFLSPLRGRPDLLGKFILVISMAALIAFAITRARQTRKPFFCLAWFLLTLGPMLLLPDRHTEYYLAAPVIGLAVLAGWGVAAGWAARPVWPCLALIPVALWFTGMIPAVEAATRGYIEESRRSRAIVLGVQSARETHPDKPIVLAGISKQLYEVSLFQWGFRAFGLRDVYLAPGSAKDISPAPDDEGYSKLELDAEVMAHALDREDAIVYTFRSDHLRNITADYAMHDAALKSAQAIPSRVLIVNPLYSYLLGAGWMGELNSARWMASSASLRIAGPRHSGSSLTLSGYCAGEQLRRGPLHLRVFADEAPIGEYTVTGPDTHFVPAFPLPETTVGKQSVNIAIHVDPVTRIGGIDYGALFDVISIQPRR